MQFPLFRDGFQSNVPHETKIRSSAFELCISRLSIGLLPGGNNRQRSEHVETAGDQQLVLGGNDANARRVSGLVHYTMRAGQPSL